MTETAPVDRSPKGHDPEGHGAKHESAATERSDGGRPTSISGVKELRKALERIAALTPERANAATAHDLYCTVSAIAETALASQSPPPTDDVTLGMEAIRQGDEIAVKAWDRTRTVGGAFWSELPDKFKALARNAAADGYTAGFKAALSAQLPPPIRGEGLVEQLRRLATDQSPGSPLRKAWERFCVGDCDGFPVLTMGEAIEEFFDEALALATPSSPEGWVLPIELRQAVEDKVALTVVRDVSELPDRSSPDDQPDMMLVTYEELELIVREAVGQALAASPSSTLGEEK